MARKKIDSLDPQLPPDSEVFDGGMASIPEGSAVERGVDPEPEEMVESPAHDYALVPSSEYAEEPEPEQPFEMAASEIPAPMTIDLPADIVAMLDTLGSSVMPDTPQGVAIDEEPELTEHQEAVNELGVGGRIEIEVDGFRVVSGSRPPVFGHGKTIADALYAMKHPVKG